MSVGIECPVCEAIFAVKQVSSKTGIRCPECTRKFRYSEEIVTTKKPSKKANGSTEESTDEPKHQSKPASAKFEPTADNASASASEPTADEVARSKKDSKWKTSATQPPRLQTPKPVLKDKPVQDDSQDKPHQVNERESEDIESILTRKKRKSRRQTIYSAITIAILSIVTAILGFVLYRQLNLPVEQLAGGSGSIGTNQAPTNAAPQNPQPVASQQINSDVRLATEPDEPAEVEEPDEDENSIELPRVLAADLPKREFEFLHKKEMRTVWQRIRPRLISLTVRTDVGPIQSVGTIVDSRGWALTSNQLVSKWPDVSATASARNIDAYYADVDARKKTADGEASPTLLTDVSRGIASAQPKRDQALLALNNRFVVSLDKFEFVARTKIVAGVYLIQAGPPSPTNPYGYEELEVLERQDLEELETEARNKAKALGIDDPLATWIVTKKKAAPVVGTPVFTRNSEMVGTFAFSTKQFAYFVLTDQARDLIAQAVKSGVEKGELKQADPVIDLLAPSHPMARPSELLNRAGVACEAFGWIAEDDDQYKQLQKFSRRFTTVAKFIQDNQDDASESISLSILADQTKRWQRSLSTSIRDSYTQSPEKIVKLNAIAIDKLTARRPNTASTYIPFVAEFYIRGFDELTNEESILLTLNEDQSIIKVPFSGRIRGMRPGSLWLCFYRRPSELSRSLVKLNSGVTSPLYNGGNILKVLGPIEKR